MTEKHANERFIISKSVYIVIKHIVRIIYASKTKKDVDDIIDTMSETDKKYLVLDNGSYLSIQQGKHLVKRFIEKIDKTPVAFLDLLEDGNNINIVIGTRSGDIYRRKGYATIIAKKGKEYLDKHYSEFDKAIWGVEKNNIYSISIAKKLGFEYEPESEGNDGFINYIYKPKNTNNGVHDLM